MELTEDLLWRRARRRYELGRLRHTLQHSWPVVPIIAVGALYHSDAALIASAGVILFALATLFSWLSWIARAWASRMFQAFSKSDIMRREVSGVHESSPGSSVNN